MTEASRILIGDVRDGLRSLPAGSVHCCVTSPPYWGLRDYGVDGQIGLEPTPDAFVASMVEVFREVRRVLREDGTLWLNLGDAYGGPKGNTRGEGAGGGEDRGVAAFGRAIGGGVMASMKPKDLCMMPWRVVLALQADGWWIRSVIVWAKKSPMPESVTDRPTSSWEPIFLLAKTERYWYDAEAVKEESSTEPHAPGYVNGAAYAVGPMDRGGHSQREQPDRVWGGGGRNLRNVWHLGPEPYAEAHFATFPTEIPRRCIKAGTSEKGCCPTCGAGWVRVLDKHKSVRTVGWSQSCECPPAEPVPCLVLDPFLGSGTTVAVARTLGRHGVGCELNPKYAELARVRIGKAEKPDTFVDPRVKDSPLFAETK